VSKHESSGTGIASGFTSLTRREMHALSGEGDATALMVGRLGDEEVGVTSELDQGSVRSAVSCVRDGEVASREADACVGDEVRQRPAVQPKWSELILPGRKGPPSEDLIDGTVVILLQSGQSFPNAIGGVHRNRRLVAPDGVSVRRAVIVAVSLYVCAALGTRVAEAAGMRRCECPSSCWCQRPLLSAFRWVLPVGHR
jgi:hypothetical protein